MTCDGCGVDCTATVVHATALLRIHPRTNKETTETRTRRLCVRCGGGDAFEALVAPIARTRIVRDRPAADRGWASGHNLARGRGKRCTGSVTGRTRDLPAPGAAVERQIGAVASSDGTTV